MHAYVHKINFHSSAEINRKKAKEQKQVNLQQRHHLIRLSFLFYGQDWIIYSEGKTEILVHTIFQNSQRNDKNTSFLFFSANKIAY